MKNLVRYLLKNRMNLPADDWTMQGIGFLRLRIDDSTRLHIWDSRLRQPGVSDIHDHTQWAFTSYVISGSIINVRYTIDPIGQPHKMAKSAGLLCRYSMLKPQSPQRSRKQHNPSDSISRQPPP